jgi:hypothetical protein
MTQDLKLRHVCPHRIHLEWIALEEDFMSLSVSKPIASKSSVDVYVNGVRVDPDRGVLMPAKLKITQAPVTIIDGVNDRIALRVDQQDRIVVNLAPGRYATGQDAIAHVQIEGVVVSAGGISTMTLGPQASLFLDAVTAREKAGHQTLGVSARRFIRGTEEMPGYGVVEDPVTLRSRIVFRSEIRSLNPICEVSYTTVRSFCPRCVGLGVEDDVRYNNRGDFLFVRNSALLLQEAEKMILTQAGSNVFHPHYGSRILDQIGSKRVGANSVMEGFITSEAARVMERYRETKLFQERYQPVTDLEMIDRVVSIRVVPVVQDPTSVILRIELRSRAGVEEVIEDIITLPDALLNFNNVVRVG